MRSEAAIGSAVGAAVRGLPRGRNRVALLLHSRGPRSCRGRDASGYLRSFDLRDLLQAQWFCGVPVGLAQEALSCLTAGSWVIDVGANVGIVTGQMCAAVGPGGRVTALEPVPANADRLRSLARDNGLAHLEVVQVAAAEAAGRQALHLPPEGNSGWGSFSASWLDSGSLEVELQPLDDLVASRRTPDHPRVDLVKVDVEGYEFEVLEGARRMLAADRPVLVIELNDPLLRDRGRSSLELLAACRELGYEPSSEIPPEWLQGAVRDMVLRPTGSS
jgi:FkbM family methyltransferase